MNFGIFICIFAGIVLLGTFIFLTVVIIKNKKYNKYIKDKKKEFYDNYYYRIKSYRSFASTVYQYYAEIYTIIPYEEITLVTTELFYIEEDAERKAKQLIKEFENARDKN